MAHREFTDRHGRRWQVWEVCPSMLERRTGGQRGQPARERRIRDEPRAALPRSLRNGWLAFECRSERRRLAPPPEHWEELSDEELATLLESASARVRPRRLIE